jgi:hypothetical protein
MFRRLLPALLLIPVVSCDRAPQPRAQVPATRAAQNDVDARSAAASADAVKHPVLLNVDGEVREFPPAKLVVETRNNRTVAFLLSDDPPQAIDNDYKGNSYYLELTFAEELPTLRDHAWTFQAPSVQRMDSPNGIFLEGNRFHLQPFAVKIAFEHTDEGDSAIVGGTFYLYELSRPAGADQPEPQPRAVNVTGRMSVKIP